jgi:putative Mn2+ efflux pump MntP
MKTILNFSIWLKVKTWIIIGFLGWGLIEFLNSEFIKTFADPKGAAIMYLIGSLFIILTIECNEELEHDIDEIEPGM